MFPTKKLFKYYKNKPIAQNMTFFLWLTLCNTSIENADGEKQKTDDSQSNIKLRTINRLVMWQVELELKHSLMILL